MSKNEAANQIIAAPSGCSLGFCLSVCLMLLTGCGADPSGSGNDSGVGAPGDGAPADGARGLSQPCGDEICRVDQTCSNDTCTFACTGTRVPGDYATIDEAALALRYVAESVICLEAQSYPVGELILADDLTIIGVSASKTSLERTPNIVVRGNVSFKGVTIDTGLTLDGGGSSTRFTGVKIIDGVRLKRYYSPTGDGGHSVVFDGADIAGGIDISEGCPAQQCTGTLDLDLRNSYLHDAMHCLRVNEGHPSVKIDVNAVNNTIVACDYGVLVFGSILYGDNTTLNLHNNIIANHSITGVSVPALTALATSNNALWNNTANYAEAAIDGPDYVKQDCFLNSQVPPVPSESSLCRGGANVAHAPEVDFLGRTRTEPNDIGAMEPQ